MFRNHLNRLNRSIAAPESAEDKVTLRFHEPATFHRRPSSRRPTEKAGS